VPTPGYILELRRSIGHALLLLPGVSAVVVDGAAGAERVLLVRRSDSGSWSLPAGIVEPGEQPADTVAREVLEETCVRVRPERLALLSVDPEQTYANGDRCQYVSMTFRCGYLDGTAQVGDEESTEVGWFALSDLPVLSERDQRRLQAGLEPSGDTEFACA
jgi:8-oxo-dGTP diphosphatase